MTNKTILEVCLSPDLGGLELYMSKCSKEFSKEFRVCNLIAKSSKLEKHFQDNESVFSLKRKSSFSLVNAYKLAKIIDSEKIDIIHLHWTKDIPIVVIGKLLSKRKPKVVQSRHMTMTRFKDDFYHRFLYKNIDVMIAVTKELEKQLYKFIPENVRPQIEQVYLGAQCPDFYDRNEIDSFRQSVDCQKSFMVGLVGRINEFKGQYLLIDAMKILKDKGLDIKAFFVGHPMKESYLDELKTKVNSLNLNQDVTFLGFTKEPHKFMQACDCVVMASKNETFGLVTIEAMQMGTVVVGANSGGVLEIIDDEKTGLLFENRDAVSLSNKIEHLYSNQGFKKELETNAITKISHDFDQEKQFQQLLAIFRDL